MEQFFTVNFSIQSLLFTKAVARIDLSHVFLVYGNSFLNIRGKTALRHFFWGGGATFIKQGKRSSIL